MNARIAIDPRVQHGKPVIRGTRVPVARVLGSLAAGMTRADIAQEYGIETDERGHFAIHVRDVKLGGAADEEIAVRRDCDSRDSANGRIGFHPPLDCGVSRR